MTKTHGAGFICFRPQMLNCTATASGCCHQPSNQGSYSIGCVRIRVKTTTSATRCWSLLSTGWEASPAAPGSVPGPSRLMRSHKISLLFPSFPRQAGSAPLPAAPTSNGGGAANGTAWGTGAAAGTARDCDPTGLAGPTPAADWPARRGSCPENTRARGGRGGSGAGGAPWETSRAMWAGDGARAAGLCGAAGTGGG
jgi:hypothetical protein